MLITVGTSKFDRLFRAVDSSVLLRKYRVICQIGVGSYLPSVGQVIRHSDRFDNIFASADLIICHAGIGTVFEGLRLKKRLVVVPNNDRVDKHQNELAKYLIANELAEVAVDLESLDNCIRRAMTQEPKVFKPTAFFKKAEVLSLIRCRADSP